MVGAYGPYIPFLKHCIITWRSAGFVCFHTQYLFFLSLSSVEDANTICDLELIALNPVSHLQNEILVFTLKAYHTVYMKHHFSKGLI